MSDRLIFVSCGQATANELAVGQMIKAFIDAELGFQAYFADTEQDLEGLSRHIFDALRRCAGIVAVLHARGKVLQPDGSVSGIRTSPWINQEIAIAAFRQFYESRPVPVLAFAQEGVMLEGAMTALIVNPRPLNLGMISRDLTAWLHQISGNSLVPDADAEFDAKWSVLSPKTIKVLDCVAREGGTDVPEDLIWQCLNRYGMAHDDRAMVGAKSEFQRTGLVRVKRDRGVFTMSIPEAWQWHVGRALARWRAGQDES